MDNLNSSPDVVALVDNLLDPGDRIGSSQAAKRRKLEEIEKRPIPNFDSLKSEVYKHFEWINADRQWKCKYCKSQFTHLAKGGSGSLGTHLRGKHAEKTKDGGSQTLEKFYSTIPLPQKPVVEPITRERFKEKITAFLIETDQPFLLVEEPSFRELIGFCSSQNDKCSLVSDTTAKEWVDNLYGKEKQNLKKTLEQNSSMISFILDVWTSGNQHAFQGVVACWINDAWELCHTVIDMSILEGHHSGENLAEQFANVLEDYDLWNKLLAVTTDNASNMKTLLEDIEEKSKERMAQFRVNEHRVRCLAHIINLACKAALKAIDKQTFSLDDLDEEDEIEAARENSINLTAIRRGVMEIRRTPQRRQAFRKHCAKLGLPDKMLILDVPTRWNSTLKMLQVLLELKGGYISMTEDTRELNKYTIDEDSLVWSTITELISFLKPFEEATKLLSQGHSPTLSDAAAVYFYLFEHLEKYLDEPSTSLQKTRSRTHVQSTRPVWQVDAAKEGWDKLQKYYSECDQLVYVVATILDPRYKLQWLQHAWEKQHVDEAKKKITQLWNRKYSPGKTSATEKVTAESGLNIASLVAEKLKSYHATEDELKRYLSEPVINPSKMSHGITGALQWWKVHEKEEFPTLAKMARDFLAVSATGVPVERLFSSGPDLISHRRYRLSDESVRKAMCLKQWLKCKRTDSDACTMYSLELFQEGVLFKAGLKDDE